MQYILNETEYQAFISLKEENAKLSHKLAVSAKTREMDRVQIDELKRSYDILSAKLAKQTQLLLAQEAELAHISGQNVEMRRDAEGSAKALADARAKAERLQELADERLVSMRNLSNEVRRLRAEHVCVAQNPRTGTVKVISVDKADTFRQFGWTVSEEFLVDRPA